MINAKEVEVLVSCDLCDPNQNLFGGTGIKKN
jgi:hypothetical protein